MNNKHPQKQLLLLRWQSLRVYNIVILAAFLFFYVAGSLQSYIFFSTSAAFNLPFIYPLLAVFLCIYLLHSLITKKEKNIFWLLPVLTFLSTLFITINSHFETATTQNSFLYCALLLPLFYSYLLAYNFRLLVINHIVIVVTYTFTAIVGDTATLTFIINALFLLALTVLTLFSNIKNNSLRTSPKTKKKANINQADTINVAYLPKIIHDVRQPLSSISLYSHLLEKYLADNAPQGIVQNLQNSTEQLECKLTTLFDLYALDSKKITPQIKNIHLLNTLSPLIKKYQQQAKLHNFIFNIQITDASINSDGKLLNDILDVLISNALQHSKQSTDRKILLSARKLQGKVNLQVWNQGSRISEQHLNCLFDEANYNNKAKTNKQSGLGLGLAIAQRKAQLLNTCINVKTSNQGSCFSIAMEQGGPIIKNQRQEGYAAENNENVLLVDDDSSILNALSLLLTNWGYKVYCATTAEQALATLSQEEISVLISDFRLPGPQNGIDLISTAQKERKITTVLLTGEIDSAKLKAGSSLDYKILHKPVKPAALRVLLRQLASSTL